MNGLRLNRTSVGLKLETSFGNNSVAVRLNRTSVGLKPGQGREATRGEAGLNRTSVGLKRRPLGLAPTRAREASIEPAWD